jgi:glycerol uptake facilitator protein
VDDNMAEVSLDKKLVAEFLGTAALVFCGPGTAVATGVIKAPFSMAELTGISFAFMLVIVAIIYTIGHISGCHINPAITLALAAAKKAPWSDVPGYIVAQVAGAIVGSLGIFAIFGDKAVKNPLSPMGILSYADGNTGHAFAAELIGTFLLALVVFGTATDSRATPGWYGLAIPSVVFAIITVAAPVTGAALNPARYIGPMIAGAVTGVDKKSLLWGQAPVYIVAEIVAALLAAGVYAYIGSVKSTESVSA